MIDKPEKPFPSPEELLKETPGLKITRVSQSTFLGKKDPGSKGICFGLSATHIIEQLSASNGEVVNPFHHEKLLNKAYEMHKTDAHIPREFEKSLAVPSRFFKSWGTYEGKEDDLAQERRLHLMQKKMEHNIQQTLKKEQPRGLIMSTQVRRFPLNGDKVDGRHVFSFTSQLNNGHVLCTGMDSNIFIATGHGEEGCNQLAKKMADTMRAYDSIEPYFYNAKASPILNNHDPDPQELVKLLKK